MFQHIVHRFALFEEISNQHLAINTCSVTESSLLEYLYCTSNSVLLPQVSNTEYECLYNTINGITF